MIIVVLTSGKSVPVLGGYAPTRHKGGHFQAVEAMVYGAVNFIPVTTLMSASPGLFWLSMGGNWPLDILTSDATVNWLTWHCFGIARLLGD